MSTTLLVPGFSCSFLIAVYVKTLLLYYLVTETDIVSHLYLGGGRRRSSCRIKFKAPSSILSQTAYMKFTYLEPDFSGAFYVFPIVSAVVQI